MPIFVQNSVTVRVPASSANLGPGFDCLALALTLADEIEAEVTPSGLVVEIDGEGAEELPRDEKHLVVQAARMAFDALGGQPNGLRLHCRNVIPQSRGLGSSSAAIVAGILLARALVTDGDQLLDNAGVLTLADRIEGHPDNVAACLLGGLVIAWRDELGVRAVTCRPVEELSPVVYIPSERGITAHARAILPSEVPHNDAAATVSRAVLLVHALCDEPDLLLPATEDWLHQDARADVMPESATLIEKLRATGISAVLSGAGPSVLALTCDERAIELATYTSFEAHRLHIDRIGATVAPVSVGHDPR
jgi:homoserine kinase